MANRKKIHVKKGDTVMVLSGDDKGKSGRVLAVYPTDNRALVEGLNMVTKHRKPTAQNTSGKIDKIEAPMHISKLMVMVGNAPSRIGRKLDEDGKLQRYSKKSGEIIK
jgi:large subunit ribosomal protein L24